MGQIKNIKLHIVTDIKRLRRTMLNNTTNMSDEIDQDHMKLLPILIPAIVVGVFVCAFNIFTIVLILSCKRLRRPSNVAIISILLGAALQGLLTTPTYVFKKLDGHKNHEEWLCDFSRLPYFLCGHVLKMSLMLVSVDRCLAINYPYRYKKLVTRKVYAIVLSFVWCVVVVVDLVPFLPFGKERDFEGCLYVPRRDWGLAVIIAFNAIPFFVIAHNYFVIWRVAMKMTFKEYYMKESLSNNDTANDTPDATQMIPVSGKQEELVMEDEEDQDKHKMMVNPCSEADNQTDTRSSLIRTK